MSDEGDLLRSVIENIPDQVYVKDMHSRFVTANPVTANFFGVSSPDDLCGKCDHDFFAHEQAAHFFEEEQALLCRNQPCVNREALITNADGTRRWFLTTKVPLRDRRGHIRGLLGINRDITERRVAEEALLQLNAELEQRVTEQTNDLRQAVARLKADDRARAEFVSSVSHELKTPLAAMKYAIENMLGGVVGTLPAPAKEYLQMLFEDCQRMSDTIEDILDFSRLENRTMRLERARIPFGTLIRQAVAAQRSQARIKGIALTLSIGRGAGFVECDALKMVRAISNVIGNAIKFTPAGGHVEISLRRDADALVLDVTDTGIGIPPQYLDRVTEKYFRVGEHVSGTGLGLSIVKAIVDLHGGQLVIQSPPPGGTGGTRVSIRLCGAEPLTVLIAGDDVPVRTRLERQLRAHGYQVLAPDAGDETLELVRRSGPDVVICTASETVMDGNHLIVRMKADRQLDKIPVVAVAARAEPLVRHPILNGLGIPILQNPWKAKALPDLLRTAVRCHQAGQRPPAG